ncbi:XrtV sorting system accessory protein [Bradyrhizobium sp. WSM3983]|uniref:XrtV sorting system accessory protein n=1 Tax=Bradyrhizobium sp. WSM3983 TaxID=1038867 RepID=UPI0004115B44|nr:XrtV sorting system accessory protein [Bradyrhizobium sp. WSM3983]
MATLFDIVTVTSFVGLVLAFFQFSDREMRTLMHLMLAGIVFAVANQVGNAGYFILAAGLILAGILFAVLAIKR